MKIFKHLLLAMLVLSAGPVLAADWKNDKPEAAINKLPAGKGLRTHTSPDKKRFLIARDEGGHGDFFYEQIYYFNGKQYTLLGTFMQRGVVTPVKWTKDSVSFEAWIPTGSDRADVMQLEYYPAKGLLRSKKIRTEAVQATG